MTLDYAKTYKCIDSAPVIARWLFFQWGKLTGT